MGQGAPGLVRFARAERLVHRAVAILMLTSIGTAAVLYNGFLAVPVGHRRLVKLIHVWAGFALPLPVLAGVLSAAYRADLGRLNRFVPDDWRWLRSRARRDGTIRVGKFNAGQKLNAALSAGGIAVLLATGTLMYFPGLARLSWRTGATFVHDWFALAVGLLVLGHVSYALRDPEARRGMRTGRVAAGWARTHHGAWAAEVDSVVIDEPAKSSPHRASRVFGRTSGSAPSNSGPAFKERTLPPRSSPAGRTGSGEPERDLGSSEWT